MDDLLPHDTEAHLAVMADLREQLAGLARAKDERLKQVLETGAVVHSDASIHRGMHAARPPADGEKTTISVRSEA